MTDILVELVNLELDLGQNKGAATLEDVGGIFGQDGILHLLEYSAVDWDWERLWMKKKSVGWGYRLHLTNTELFGKRKQFFHLRSWYFPTLF